MQECNKPSIVEDIKGDFPMSDNHRFERLLEAAGLIARHADFPNKRQVVERCREEVEDLRSSGAISSTQGESLEELLLGGRVQTMS